MVRLTSNFFHMFNLCFFHVPICPTAFRFSYKSMAGKEVALSVSDSFAAGTQDGRDHHEVLDVSMVGKTMP